MTLLLLDEHHHLAAVEIGTSHRGEIARLAAVARPDAGVLTLVAPEHTEGIGSLDDVAEEEGDLFAALPPEAAARSGTATTRASRPRSCGRPRRRRILYGFGEACSLRALSREPRGLAGSLVRVAWDGGDPADVRGPAPRRGGGSRRARGPRRRPRAPRRDGLSRGPPRGAPAGRGGPRRPLRRGDPRRRHGPPRRHLQLEHRVGEVLAEDGARAGGLPRPPARPRPRRDARDGAARRAGARRGGAGRRRGRPRRPSSP